MAEGVYELHWQDREHGERSFQLYARGRDGQLRLVDTLDQGPFDSSFWCWNRLSKLMILDMAIQAA